MNKHLVIVCTLPTALFLTGAFLTYLDNKFPIPENRTIRNVGCIFMAGAIAIVLQVTYSLYWG